MDLLQSFKNYVAKHRLFQLKDRLLLAVSGGVDSVVLCELCSRAGYDFTIAHCNFQLRDEESERDEQFVRSLGEKYHSPVLVKRFDTKQFSIAQKCSIQEAARVLRYNWFYEILKEPAAPKYILTAHHADDNIETMLMNLFKGTGIAGLRGMLPAHNNLIRPLLFASKKDLAEFANDHKLSWVEDSSNTEDKYSRNFIRHHVMPVIQSLYPQAETNLAGNIERFRETELLYRTYIDSLLKKLVEHKGNELHIPVLKLQRTGAVTTILFEILQPLGFTAKQSEEAAQLLESETGRYVSSGTHRIIRNRQWLILAPNDNEQTQHIFIEMGVHLVPFAAGVLNIVEEKLAKAGDALEAIPAEVSVALLDGSDIKYPLLLRHWKQGDYFYPLGMRKKKKLARFFIDQKLSSTEKEKVWVLESNKKIIWVVGMRIDDRFKISPATRKTLRIEWKHS